MAPTTPTSTSKSTHNANGSLRFQYRSYMDTFRPPTFKLDNLGLLEGDSNYDLWANAMKVVLRSCGAMDIVVNGAQPSDDASDSEIQAYELIKNHAAGILIQTVSKDVLERTVEMEDPHEIWTYLQAQHQRSSNYSVTKQITDFVNLKSTYDPNCDHAEWFANNETNRTRLKEMLRRMKGQKSAYIETLLKLLEHDEFLRDLELGAIHPHRPDFVDSLSLANLSRAECKQRIIDSQENLTPKNEQAYSATQSKKGKKPQPSSSSNNSSSSSSKTKECTWCAKRFPGKHLGHTWQECFKLKKHNEEKGKGKDDKKDVKEEAHATTGNKDVSNHPFYLDTACTSHMIPFIDRIEHFKVRSGFVRSSSNQLMKIKGEGYVVMDTVLRDGTVSSFRVFVLYVPDLPHPLISWRKLAATGYSMFATGEYIRVFKGNKTFIEAVYDGTLFKIPEVNDSAFLTYDFWHKALGHLAPSSIEKARPSYLDANVIPQPPKDFHCEDCAIAKSTHAKPRSTEKKVTQKFDLIHTDLSGPFPVPSFGGSLYYMSLIDDSTRTTWIRFMKHKSETTKLVKDFVTEMETQHGIRIKRFRCDNGREYINKELDNALKAKGILIDPLPPYSPESNGVAERFNRTMGEALRAMLLPLGIKQLWAEAAAYFVYTKNRQPHKAISDRTPYEAFNGTKPMVSHLQPFGRECYVHIPLAKRPAGMKLTPRADRGLFVGYTNVEQHYRVFITEQKRTFISRDVFFPPYKSEGASTKATTTELRSPSVLRSSSLETNTSSTTSPQTVTIEGQHNPQGFPTDDMWIAWMERHPDTANQWFNQGHPKVTQLFNREFNKGRRDTFLGPDYWDYQNNDISQSSSQNTPEPDQHIEPETSPPTTPTTPAPSPQQQIVTRSGRTVRPPREWWVVNQGHQEETRDTPRSNAPPDLDGDEPMPDAPALNESTSTESTLFVEGLALSASIIPEPKSFQQAKASTEWPEWRKAMDEELRSLQENEVWQVVPKPPNRKIVDSKWVYKVKTDADGNLERYKARLVARGFTQVPGQDFDEIFSPVVRYDSMRLLLAISASKRWKPRQLDVKTAFLYGVLKEEVYMQLPEGSREDGKCALLKRCI